jgi:hypothetical protein
MQSRWSGHALHQHGETWFLQLMGRKVWFLQHTDKGGAGQQAAGFKGAARSFLRPPLRPFDKPFVGASDVAGGRITSLVEGESGGPCAYAASADADSVFNALTTACYQSPGDLLWFPSGTFHGTCSPDDWSVGFGSTTEDIGSSGQGGSTTSAFGAAQYDTDTGPSKPFTRADHCAHVLLDGRSVCKDSSMTSVQSVQSLLDSLSLGSFESRFAEDLGLDLMQSVQQIVQSCDKSTLLGIGLTAAQADALIVEAGLHVNGDDAS